MTKREIEQGLRKLHFQRQDALERGDSEWFDAINEAIRQGNQLLVRAEAQDDQDEGDTTHYA